MTRFVLFTNKDGNDIYLKASSIDSIVDKSNEDNSTKSRIWCGGICFMVREDISEVTEIVGYHARLACLQGEDAFNGDYK